MNHRSFENIFYIVLGLTIFLMAVGGFIFRLLLACAGLYLIYTGIKRHMFAYMTQRMFRDRFDM